MQRGESYIVEFRKYNKRFLTTFYEDANGTYIFRDKNGLFGVTEKSIRNGEITLRLIED